MRRTASTLIELTISLPVFSMLMVLAIGGVHQTMQVSRLAKDRGHLACTLAKLEQTMRSDVRQCTSATVARMEKTGLLSLRLGWPDGCQVVYSCRANRIDREQKDANGNDSFESFLLFHGNRVHLEVEENRCVLLSVHRKHRDHASADRLELLVRSTIGRKHLVSEEPKGVADD